jgi:outer membrane protein, multidrug efflux system
MKNHLVKTLLFVASITLLASCAVGPRHEIPEADTELGFVPRKGDLDLSTLNWWEQFGDPTLNDLIKTALQNNQDLAAARSRWAKSLAMVKQAGGAKQPRLDASTSVIRQERSENGLVPVIAGNPAFPGRTETLFSGGLQLSWEMDLFGRIDSQTEAVEKGALVAELGIADGQRLVLAATGRNYLQYIAYTRQIELIQEQIGQLSKILEIDQYRHQIGTVPKDTVDADKVQLQKITAGLPELQAARESVLLCLAVLTALDAEEIRARFDASTPTDFATTPFEGASIDSDHLLNRPDLRIARTRLDQSIAQHHVAVANLYPRFTLIGALGQESIDAGDLLDAASRFWKLGPSFTLPILNGGQLRAEVEVQQEEVRVRLAEFKGAYFNALAESQNALNRYIQSFRNLEALRQQVQATEARKRTMEARFTTGVVSRDQLYASQIAVAGVQSEWITSKVRNAIALIDLCEAVGGAWTL